ncbi:MAG: HAD-IA family hydrolase [Clostridia bacterium]|nr:HAD-IA family hydrolase [Clostridia bacterium]
MYKYLLADNDNTLMDFTLAEARALREAMTIYHVQDDDETVAAYHRINDAQWKALERGETTQDKLKVDRFVLFLEAIGRKDVDGAAMSECYEECLSHHAEMMEGAQAFLEQVHDRGVKIALVSNGISRIQRGRLSCCSFAHLLDAVIISSEIGVNKPDPRVVEAALAQLKCEDKQQAVLLGDSLTADVGAARNAGVDSIWLSLKGGTSDLPTYTVTDLKQAAGIIIGE